MKAVSYLVYTVVYIVCQTTAVSMAWCLLMLAKHPDIQQKARDEVMSVIGTSQPLTYDNLDQLEYCGCVVKETLRLIDSSFSLSSVHLWGSLATIDIATLDSLSTELI